MCHLEKKSIIERWGLSRYRPSAVETFLTAQDIPTKYVNYQAVTLPSLNHLVSFDPVITDK